MSQAVKFDHEVDVLVVGSGAGGLISALVAAKRGASALVIEKSELWGGTSATSGGGIWIPNSHLAQAQGITDSEEAAFTYVRAQSADNVPDENIRAFIREAPKMLKWLEDNSPVRYLSIPYTDYHAELPGGKPEGFRSHLPLPMDGRLLGEDVLTLRAASPAASLFGYINWNFTETTSLLLRAPGWWRMLAKMVARYYLDLPTRLFTRKDRNLTLGNALVGGLGYALKQQGVEIWRRTSLAEILRDESGRVIGIAADRNGVRMTIGARRGVILAAGGFERNAQMRSQHLAVHDPRMSGGQINNTGDAIRAAEGIGAGMRNLDSVWWAPVFSVPGEERGRLCTIERALPGCIIVNQAGKRFLNEAASYHVVGSQIAANNTPEAPTQPSYVIFDAAFRQKYPMGPVMPIVPDWLHPKNVRAILHSSATLAGLARKIGVPAAALEDTVTRFNGFAQTGVDADFGRGSAAYDRFYGDPRVTPNPCLGPLLKAPFYAVPIYAGDIGTNGGIVTDDKARVLDDDGRMISGLYAVGNNAASAMGRSYPGAGVTLGPSMTFGYVAARHATGAND